MRHFYSSPIRVQYGDLITYQPALITKADHNKPIDQAFPAIENPQAETLILGSMPGAASLQAQQYYAHPRNAFWPIITQLLAQTSELSYHQRTALLQQHRIALWDVLQSCHRPGSLDAKIDMDSVSVNDFNRFYTQHPNIQRVFFNGGMAEKLYKKRVMPTLYPQFSELQYIRLPSTSPAYAAMNQAQKLQVWRQIKR